MDSTEATTGEKTSEAKHALQSLVDLLAHYRGWLVGAYSILLALWVLLFLYSDFWVFPEFFAAMAGYFDPQMTPLKWEGVGGRIIAVGVFLAIQVVFTLGIGRISVAGQRTKFRKLWASVIIFSTLMTLLTLGIVLSFADMTDRVVSTVRLTGQLTITARQLGAALIAAWLGWLLFAWLSVRNVDRRTAVSRLTTTILTGSWIEFSVALPIELAKRERNQDCPCAAGSWWALVICLPILLWSIGPALFVLYRREQLLCASDSRHALRAVLGKCAKAEKTRS